MKQRNVRMRLQLPAERKYDLNYLKFRKFLLTLKKTQFCSDTYGQAVDFHKFPLLQKISFCLILPQIYFNWKLFQTVFQSLSGMLLRSFAWPHRWRVTQAPECSSYIVATSDGILEIRHYRCDVTNNRVQYRTHSLYGKQTDSSNNKLWWCLHVFRGISRSVLIWHNLRFYSLSCGVFLRDYALLCPSVSVWRSMQWKQCGANREV